MSRQYNGEFMHPEAAKFLRENAALVPDRICGNCKQPVDHKYKIIEQHIEDLFFGDGPMLRTIELKDGRIAKEVIQCAPWDSGPYAFITIEVDGKRIAEFTDAEINERM